MYQRTKDDPTSRPILWSALISVTISSLLVLALYLSAVFGSQTAFAGLLTITLPQFNLAAAMLPIDLQSVPGGFEMILASAILQSTVVLTFVIVGALLLSKRAGLTT